jgi:hypothetical protein
LVSAIIKMEDAPILAISFSNKEKSSLTINGDLTNQLT